MDPIAAEPAGRGRAPRRPTGTGRAAVAAGRSRRARRAPAAYRSAPGGSRSTARSAESARSSDADRRAARRRSPVRRRAGAGGRAPRTTPVGDAVRRNDARRPAHRHAAQPARSISSAPGPRPVTLASGSQRDARRRARRRRPRPSPPTRRPCRSIAHHVADAHLARCRRGRGSRTPCRSPARRAGPGRPRGSRHPSTGQPFATLGRAGGRTDRSTCRSDDQRPRADLRSSTRVVCSQVKSGSSRPKCP